MGRATCTLALGRILPQDVSCSAGDLSELNILTFPSLPYRITFLLNTETPLTITFPELGAQNMSKDTSKKNVISTE